ncbi:serine/threonine protein kinase [Geomesophilobacter sediminis]|uniref:non-specific serine/threonine protein kinase n=1 Tax=Geomesophilobacter sediminis TaxID=2798584 RepID=A0A8J7IPT8_9BACT|nr:serine/threonine-protein kinase [Geomesophilobacter sediminis]MBJ6724489.1 serine/threonine protein kinase [Geomesophilobacter sediminis]
MPEAQPRPTGYDLQPEQILDGRFLLIEIVSRSGMATIFKAIDQDNGQIVAIKVPYLHFESSPAFYSRFIREGEVGAKLDHPYLLKFIEVPNRSRPYLVMEFLEGETLAERLKRSGTLPEAEALSLASRICEALSYMHEHQVIHRDLKPQNVMLLTDGSIRVLDFGISKTIGRRFTFVGFTPALGTPEFMAPEQVLGKRGDERTDIYSLGTVLYRMLVGSNPFAGESDDVFVAMNARVTGDPEAPRRLNPQISEQAEEIILHAMERDPAKRYPSAAAFKTELDAPLKVALTGRCRRLQRPSRWRRHWKNVVLIGGVLIAIACGFIKLIYMIVHHGP